MWLVAAYEPTSLFSLRYSNATTAGAKSLMVPSPYTVKMALLVAAIRTHDKEWARANFVWIRSLSPIRVRPSQFAVVNRCFLKFQSRRSEKSAKPKLESGEVDPNYVAPIGYAPTVGFREYVHLQGPIEIAFPISELGNQQEMHLRQLSMQINTFGKRGSFFQFLGYDERTELSEEFSSESFSLGGLSQGRILQPLDDMAPSLTFEKVDVTDPTPIKKQDRVTQTTFIALESRRFAASWASYERVTLP